MCIKETAEIRAWCVTVRMSWPKRKYTKTMETPGNSDPVKQCFRNIDKAQCIYHLHWRNNCNGYAHRPSLPKFLHQGANRSMQ